MAGELHPGVCTSFGLPARSCAAEIDLSALIEVMSGEPTQVKPVSTYPIAKEDIALVVSKSIPVARVEQVVRQGGGALLEEVTLFDIFESEALGADVRSLAFALKLRAPDRTLSADEVREVRENVVAKAGKVLGAQLRS